MKLFDLCLNTFACLKINRYSTGLFVSYSSVKPNYTKVTYCRLLLHFFSLDSFLWIISETGELLVNLDPTPIDENLSDIGADQRLARSQSSKTFFFISNAQG
jgi:hypothetical protein